MIIKFKTRKTIYSAKQLVRYILTDKGRIEQPFEAPIFLQHINRLDTETLHRDFLDNYKQFASKRKNSVALHHDILAISKQDAAHITTPMLSDLMRKYVELRGLENALVLAKAHENQHIHVMYSANELRSKTSLRMSQAQMKSLLRAFEQYHLESYPELEHSAVHTNKAPSIERNIAQEQKNTRREKEYQHKRRRPDQTSKKEQVKTLVENLMNQVHHFDALVNFITQSEGLELYTYKGKLRGVIYEQKKYRFSTLKVDKEKLMRLQKMQERLNQLALIKAHQHQSQSLSRGS